MNIKHQALMSLGKDKGLVVYMIPNGDTPGMYLKNNVDLVICPKSVYDRFKSKIDDSLTDSGTVLTF